MLINPTLTRDEFRDIHNALCDLDRVAQSLEDVIKSEKFILLQKAKTAIRTAMKRAYDEDDRLFKERSELCDHVRAECRFNSIWSMYEVEDFYAKHPFAGAETLTYKDHWGDKPVSAAIPGDRWIDLWRAADECIKLSSDEHHIFIEQFRKSSTDNTVLTLSTGS